MSSVRNVVRQVRSRQQTQLSWQFISQGLVLGGLLGIGLAISNLMQWSNLPKSWVIGSVFMGPAIGLIAGVLKRRSLHDAANHIDRSCELKDRTTTAMGFLQLGTNASPLQRLQIADAESHLKQVDPMQVAPVATPRSMYVGMVCTCVAFAMAMLSFEKPRAVAVEPNEVLVTQASRVDRELEQLRQLQEEQNSPEIEKLLKDLTDKLEEFKEQNVEPKEALAKLSEMEASIQKMQQQLEENQSDASLKEVGEALALSTSMSAAAQALAKGDMEKAAQELKNLEMPELDRKTEKAIAEKLENLQKNDGASKQKQLKEAAKQLSEGMCNKSGSKFSEGKEGLASECKKQGARKKLSDLLRKQCQCLSECKSECESECKSTADSKKKGGNQAGKGRSGNEAGEKTTKLKSDNKMNITGQESAQGEVDVETEHAPEKEQQASRNYRENADKYESLKESALESESIPLGHRQTIRKYFELIRPNSNSDQKD
jgi:hypothetical protein